MSASRDILTVSDLRRYFTIGSALFGGRKVVKAVDGVSFSMARGEVLGVVGESGSGKSTLARCLVGLLSPRRGAVVRSGPLEAGPAPGRNRRIQLVFQDSGAAFDPRWTVGRSLREALPPGASDREDRIAATLAALDLPADVSMRYPATLSGGERQRLALGRAILAEPDVLVLDEPVAAIDAPLRAAILVQLRALQEARGTSLVLISHDCDLVTDLADDVLVLYLGRVVEAGPRDAVFARPRHPYTQGLLASRLRVDGSFDRAGLPAGEPASVAAPPAGCGYHPRCPLVLARCRVERPPWVGGAEHRVACFAWSADAPPSPGGIEPPEVP